MLQKEIFPETCNQEMSAIGRQDEDRIERETLSLKLICLIRKICVSSCNAIDALVSIALQFVENAASRNSTLRAEKAYTKQEKNILILAVAKEHHAGLAHFEVYKCFHHKLCLLSETFGKRSLSMSNNKSIGNCSEIFNEHFPKKALVTSEKSSGYLKMLKINCHRVNCIT